jgi:hypothetical protein
METARAIQSLLAEQAYASAAVLADFLLAAVTSQHAEPSVVAEALTLVGESHAGLREYRRALLAFRRASELQDDMSLAAPVIARMVDCLLELKEHEVCGLTGFPLRGEVKILT